jgi:hypothetical protein
MPNESSHLLSALHNLPLTQAEGMQILEADKSKIKRKKLNIDHCIEAIMAVESAEVESNRRGGISLVVSDDENSRSELVYGISMNHSKKTIFVGFRGSKTRKDWRVNVRSHTKKRKILLTSARGRWFFLVPICGSMASQRSLLAWIFSRKNHSLTPFLRLLAGFYEYLMKESSRGKSKYEQICLKIWSDLNLGYSIGTRGYSLGGALATFFGFFWAAGPDRDGTPATITVISIVSPSVGNIEFFYAFQELEISLLFDQSAGSS